MFDVVQHVRRAAVAVDVFCAQILELPVCDREDDRIVSARLGLGDHFDVMFGPRLFGVYPGIVNIDLRV